MRLDRLITLFAAQSRSQAKEVLKAGRVSINGAVQRSGDARVQAGDLIALDGQPLDARCIRHVMLNKPAGVLTAARDRRQQTVLDLLPPAYAACGCMPVGRLDKDTEGLLLMTTDGELAHHLLSPKRHVWKCYLATVDGPLTALDAQAFEQGLELSDFTALPARMEICSSGPSCAVARVWVREGKFHQIKRMFAARGRTVTALKRLSFGPLALDETLSPGSFRELSGAEVNLLIRAAAGETEP